MFSIKGSLNADFLEGCPACHVVRCLRQLPPDSSCFYYLSGFDCSFICASMRALGTSWALMGSVCSSYQLNPLAAINSSQHNALTPSRGDTRLSRSPGEDPVEKGHHFLQNAGARGGGGPFPSTQLCRLEMALSPSDRCHFLLIRGGPAQLSRAHAVPAQARSSSSGWAKVRMLVGQLRVDVTPKCGQGH